MRASLNSRQLEDNTGGSKTSSQALVLLLEGYVGNEAATASSLSGSMDLSSPKPWTSMYSHCGDGERDVNPFEGVTLYSFLESP